MEKEEKGHTALIDDLTNLLAEAKEYQFHDFRNTKYAAPKMELAAQLLTLRENVINGKYD